MRILGRRIGLIGPLVIVLAALALIGWRVAVGWHPSLELYPVQGIDVTDEAGVVDWPTVRAEGVDFAYIRATSGVAGRDTLFAPNWAGAYAAGVRRGAVHVFSLCRLAADQARNFVVLVPRVADALPAAVSIEDQSECGTPPAPAVLADEVLRFAAIVERHSGKPVVVRISRGIEEKYGLSRRLDRPLWAVENFLVPTYLSRPWRMWRANDMRRIDGVERAIGWNVVAR